ncbi:MAG: hypothetical protein LAN18_14140 [Acidobacteriia bacterium]|nr:hypothetical protein [Terriglobia bacterium]
MIIRARQSSMLVIALATLAVGFFGVAVAMYFGVIDTRASKRQERQDREDHEWQLKHEAVALHVAEYDPATVSLETGQFEMPPPTKLQMVPWVRFRKAFTSAGRDMGARTIFVVSAVELASWLGKLDFMEQFASEIGKVHIQW